MLQFEGIGTTNSQDCFLLICGRCLGGGEHEGRLGASWRLLVPLLFDRCFVAWPKVLAGQRRKLN